MPRLVCPSVSAETKQTEPLAQGFRQKELKAAQC